MSDTSSEREKLSDKNSPRKDEDEEPAKIIPNRDESWKIQFSDLEVSCKNTTHYKYDDLGNPKYHSNQMIDFVLSLDWAQLRNEFDCEQSDFQTSLMTTLEDFPFTVIQHICEFTAPLWEGSWYTSGELFLRLYTNDRFVGIFGNLYVLIGEAEEDGTIQFHQYPIKNGVGRKLTLYGKYDWSNQQVHLTFADGARGPLLVRDAGPSRLILDYAAKNDIEGIQKCIQDGIDVNICSKDVLSLTPLMMASVSGSVEAVQFLLENKADPLIGHCSALSFAKRYKNTKIIEILKEEIDRLKENEESETEQNGTMS